MEKIIFNATCLSSHVNIKESPDTATQLPCNLCTKKCPLKMPLHILHEITGP